MGIVIQSSNEMRDPLATATEWLQPIEKIIFQTRFVVF